MWFDAGGTPLISIEQLVRDLRTNRTVLFFGAGSSMPSGLPSGSELKDRLASAFEIAPASFSLAEVALLAEMKTDRAHLIRELRKIIGKPQPTGALLNLPLYPWKSLFTTNYDRLVEDSYRRRDKGLVTYHTNFDFSQDVKPADQLLFKVHGTIEHDVSDSGGKSRIIITQSDYDKTEEYRESIFDRFSAELAGADLLIIGQKLDDPDIKTVVDRAISIQSKLYGAGGSTTLLLYEKDEGRAAIFESRGMRVCFAGLDDLFAAIAAQAVDELPLNLPPTDPLDMFSGLRTLTIDARHSVGAFAPNVSAMFNGRAATYADIVAKLTFDRSIANSIVKEFSGTEIITAGIIGASGVGKSTAARQTLIKLLDDGWSCWEHKADFKLLPEEWLSVAEFLTEKKQNGVLLVDDAHANLPEMNHLLELLAARNLHHLRILYTSSRNQWQYRVKTPVLFKQGKEYNLSRLNSVEVDRLLALIDQSDKIRPLVESAFAGFSRQQRRGRLVDRCEQDMFVCLKNIFATEKFDDIILREYNELGKDYQTVYRTVAAMETVGIRVHRQLIIRLLGIPADAIAALLGHLADIVMEYDLAEKESIFGWQTRHAVIAGIITAYKFHDVGEIITLFERVIDNLQPSYEIERRTINEICNLDTGLARIPDREVQNRLLRRLISMAPGERVPRHRLVRNLIDDGHFDLAETEMRVFERELGRDGPVARYRVSLLIARALYTKGLADSDRRVILEKGKAEALSAVDRYGNNRSVYAVYCDIGLHLARLTGDRTTIDDALERLIKAETRLADPEITRMIKRYERKRSSELAVYANSENSMKQADP